MRVIYNSIIPVKGFSAINLFGVLFARKGSKVTKTTLNHEAIHTAQMKELFYIPFYIIYIMEWLFNLAKGKSFKEAYRNIRFEKEAYANERKYTYLRNRSKYAWRNQ